MANLNYDQILKIHGPNAQEAWAEICTLGGFGSVPLNHDGGIAIGGALSDENTAVSDEKKARIRELIEGVDSESNAAESVIETAENLAKSNSRESLEQMAKDAGLDGNSYTNKTELAQAILDTKKDGDN